MSNNENDRKLLRQLRLFPSKGMEELMDQYSGLLYCIVRGRVGQHCSAEDIEECVSDIFVEFYKKADSIDLTRGSIRAYLAVIAKRRAIDLLRRHTSAEARTADCDDDDLEQISDRSLSLEDEMILSQLRSTLLAAIAELEQPDREIIYRRYGLEQRVTEIAAALSMNSNTVSKRIARALVRLRKYLEENDYE